MNHAVFCVTPILFDIWMEETSLRNYEIDGVHPFIHWHMRSLENRTGSHGKIYLTIKTAEIPLHLAYLDSVNTATAWAGGFTVPTTFLNVQAGSFLIGKFLKEFAIVDCDFLHQYLRDKPRPLMTWRQSLSPSVD